jgi:glycerol-3-phosphate dehydrogenase
MDYFALAFSDEEAETVGSLYERGLKNGVPGMRILSGDEAREMEPMLSKDVVSALYAATGGITCPYEMTVACAENARANGVEWLLGRAVEGIAFQDGWFTLSLGGERIRARRIVNAAGVFADEVSRMIGDDSFSVFPRKGEYLLVDRAVKSPEKVIFQTPTKLGKGVLVSPTVDGNCFAGPTSVETGDKLDTSVSAESIDMLKRLARKSAPALDFRQVITAFAGIRAQPSTGDFVIRASEKNPAFIHAAGICSPGLTSAPAVAERIEYLLRKSGLELREKQDYNPHRAHIRAFRHMTEDEKSAAIAENSLYGRVICRCETITEAEVVEAVRRGARTLDGVKRRTRAGMGRCQGGFCGPRVMEIISREAGIPMTELTKFGGKSYLLAGLTRP